MPGSKKKVEEPRLTKRQAALAAECVNSMFEPEKGIPDLESRTIMLQYVQQRFVEEGEMPDAYSEKKLLDALQNRFYKWRCNADPSSRPASWQEGARTARRRRKEQQRAHCEGGVPAAVQAQARAQAQAQQANPPVLVHATAIDWASGAVAVDATPDPVAVVYNSSGGVDHVYPESTSETEPRARGDDVRGATTYGAHAVGTGGGGDGGGEEAMMQCEDPAAPYGELPDTGSFPGTAMRTSGGSMRFSAGSLKVSSGSLRLSWGSTGSAADDAEYYGVSLPPLANVDGFEIVSREECKDYRADSAHSGGGGGAGATDTAKLRSLQNALALGALSQEQYDRVAAPRQPLDGSLASSTGSAAPSEVSMRSWNDKLDNASWLPLGASLEESSMSEA